MRVQSDDAAERGFFRVVSGISWRRYPSLPRLPDDKQCLRASAGLQAARYVRHATMMAVP